MKPLLGSLFLVVVVAATARSGSESKLEDLVKQTLSVLDRITTTLTTVRDEDTAKAAVPELKKGAEQFLTLKKKAADLPPPSKDEKDRLAKLYRSKLEEARKKLLFEVGRLKDVPGGNVALREISAVLEKDKKAKDKNGQ